MRALVWEGPEKLAVRDVEDPEPGPGEVLLVPEAVGICGSEVEGYLGHQANRTPPLVMGHELAGRVVAAGAGVDPGWVGRSAAVNPLLPGEGVLPGYENLGRHRQLIGVHRPGGFAEVVPVPVDALRALPEGTDPRLGALAEPLANGVHSVRLGLAGLEPARHAVVVGAGTIGAMVVQSAALHGLERVSAVEPHPVRREAALALGAHDAWTPEQATEELEGADLVIDAVGLPTTRGSALSLVRPGGRVVMLGLAGDETSVSFHHVVRSEISIQGSYAYSSADYDEALAWLLDGRAGIGELPAVQPLEDGPDAFAELAGGPSARVKVFLAAEPKA
jgi:2-desacetyl-2-hydroxyethyl bacteriochlorophyllide A dehydrogenase